MDVWESMYVCMHVSIYAEAYDFPGSDVSIDLFTLNGFTRDQMQHCKIFEADVTG